MVWQRSLAHTCSDPQVCSSLVAALEAFLHADEYLLQVNVNERTIAHRLACLLQLEFDEYSVDCEYNRDGHDPKEIAYGSGDDDEHGSRVYPDIIVHRRGNNDSNLLVIELKKSNNPEADDRDFEKLKSYCSQLHYLHGAFVRFRVRHDDVGIDRAEFVYPLEHYE